MLLGGEGGSFFYSSAAGYSKAITLLLLGQRKSKKPMKITPCNQYQLVDQETDPDLLASSKNCLVWRCNSFVCFVCAANKRKCSSPVTLELPPDNEVLTSYLNFDEGKDLVRLVEPVNSHDHSVYPPENAGSTIQIDSPKGILKKIENIHPVGSTAVEQYTENVKNNEAPSETDSDLPSQMDKRTVKWTDTTGGDLFEIREFEMSESESGDEFDHIRSDTCSGRCNIM